MQEIRKEMANIPAKDSFNSFMTENIVATFNDNLYKEKTEFSRRMY